jgi:hypothetical protein
LQVENIVEDFWPSIIKTWTWTSRGKGRVDRLALWIGSIAKKNSPRRFIRISPDLKQEPFIFEGGMALTQGDDIPQSILKMPKRGEYVTILDAALVECGLAQYWLNNHIDESKYHWAESVGRRPQIHHHEKFELNQEESKYLIQASGRIVEIFHQQLNMDTVDEFVGQALTHDIGKLTIRTPLEPSLHPKIQGSFDRQLSRRHGRRDAFILRHPITEMSLLCVVE